MPNETGGGTGGPLETRWSVREPPRQTSIHLLTRLASISLLRWIVILSLACSLAGMSMQHTKGPFVERLYSPAEVRVLNDVLNAVHTIANSAMVIAKDAGSVIDTTIGILVMHVHILMSYLGAGLALAMVFAELARGIYEMSEHVRRSSAERRITRDATKGWRREWKHWATGLAIAMPCLIATLYYGVHTVMA